MQPDSAASAWHAHLVDDHKALRDLLTQIEDALHTRSVSIGEVGALLGELGDRLVKHFTLEEEGGYFVEALQHAPRLVAQANRLLAQHPKMCTQADQLVNLAAAPASTDTWWAETRERFLAFKEELLRHEREEDGLLQDAYHQDLGSHD